MAQFGLERLVWDQEVGGSNPPIPTNSKSLAILRTVFNKEKKMALMSNLLSFLIILFFFNFSYAGELVSQEAVNYYNEGVKAQKADNFSAADIAYQKALLLDPYNPKWNKFIINNRGIMYAQSGDLEKAEASFNEVLKIDPNYQPAQFNLGLIYEKRRSRLESLEYWAKVFELDKLKPQDFIIEEQYLTGESK